MNNFRNYFPVFKDKIYLDFASLSPFSLIHKNCFEEAYQIQERFDVDILEKLLSLKVELKSKIANFIGASKGDHIALTLNTSYGISLLASGLGLKEGDRVLLPFYEFPANVYPFLYLKEKGVEVDFLKPEKGLIALDQIKKNIHKNTKLVSLSFVQFLNGFMAPLEEIGKFLREREIIFVVDGIQGVGLCPMDVQKFNIDGLSCGGAKWLMWPQGTGFLFVSKNIFEKIKPPMVGWLSVKDPWNFLNYNMELSPSGDRFEIGTINFMGFLCAREILSYFEKFKIENIYKKVLNLRKIFYENIKEMGFETITPEEGASGIVTLKVENPEKLYNFLKENNVIISKRLEYLRFSFHFINTEEDIEKTLKLLKKFKDGA